MKKVSTLKAKRSIAILAMLIGIVGGKLLVIGNLNYSDFQISTVSYATHIAEIAMLGTFALLYAFSDKSQRPRGVALLFLTLYCYSALASPLSTLPILSLYNAFKGFGYVCIGLVFSQLWSIKHPSTSNIVEIRRLTGWLLLLGLLGSIVQTLRVYDTGELIRNGTQAGYFTMFALFLAYLLYKSEHRRLIKYPAILSLLAIAYRMNSISSVLSVSIALACFFFFIQRRVVLGSTILILGIGLLGWAYSVIQAGGNIYIANKDSYALLTGSGRFLVYESAWDILTSGEFEWFGSGFMSERTSLVAYADVLPWYATAHNSFLTLALSLGYIGIGYYVIFVVYLARLILKKDDRSESGFMKLVLISFLAYGVTSSAFPGAPSLLVSYTTYLFTICFQTTVTPRASAPSPNSYTFASRLI